MDYITMKVLILLLLFLTETKAFNLGHTAVQSDLLSINSQRVIAPELFRNSTLAFATVETSEENRDKVGIDITITIAGKQSTDCSKCSLKLRPDDTNSSIVVTTLNRLSDKKVLLMGFEEQMDKKRKGFLIALDVKSCESLYLYSSFDLAESHVLVTRESSDKFEIFLTRRSAYPAACVDNKSRMTFKSGKKEFHCFEVDVNWSGIFIGAFSFSEDVVMVRGFDDNATYKVMVYNPAVYPYRQQLWLVLAHASDKTQVVSSDLAVCWILNLGVDKSVHCVLIDKAGDLRLNKTINYKQPVKLLSAVSQSESDAQIIVLAETVQCDGDDCDNVFVSKVSDQSINHRAIKLECSRNKDQRLALQVRQIISKGAVALEYICETFERFGRFVLHSIDIDDS